MQSYSREASKFLLCFSVLITFFSSVSAAEFSNDCPAATQPDVGCWIFLRGPIVEGDSDRLLRALKSKPKRGDIFRSLVLESPGGDVAEALKLVRLVRDALLETRNVTVFETSKATAYTCASSCVLVLMAGVERLFSPINGGRLGLHRPSFSTETYSGKLASSDLAELQHQAMRNVREFLLSEGMQQRLIEEMMNRSSREIYWVDFFKDWLEVRRSAAWFDELRISRCKFDPTAEGKAVKAMVDGDKLNAVKAQGEALLSAPCVRALISEAQAKLRR